MDPNLKCDHMSFLYKATRGTSVKVPEIQKRSYCHSQNCRRICHDNSNFICCHMGQSRKL